MLIAEIEKNAKEKIRVSIEEYKGHKFVDCRVYWKDKDENWKPSRKGIALNDETLDEVIKALKKASKHYTGAVKDNNE
jgi:predicted SpoU family rRNA methylase